MTTPRVLLVVGADASERSTGPRRDFTVLAEMLNAELIDRRSIDRSVLGRALRSVVGLAAAQAVVAYRRRNGVDIIFADGEHVGIPLALLLRLGRGGAKHIAIGHRLSSRKKLLFFRALRVQSRIDRIAVHSRSQYDFATRVLGIDSDRLVVLPYQVDTVFWSPRHTVEEPLVVSAGLEHRDYPTLLRAAHGLAANVTIGAASSWSRHRFVPSDIPANVTVGSFDYVALRDLYARAAVVVVPLRDVDNQAGVTTILEAMSMGKAVIVTQSVGQTDVVEDRRSPERGIPRPRPTSLARVLASERGLLLEPNGFYVPPGDPDTLRRAISYLLAHPELRRRLGDAGRRTVVELFSVDEFASRIRRVIESAHAADPARSVRPLELAGG